MANLRNAILVAVLAATAIAAIAGTFVVGGPPSRLLVDAGLFAALGIIVFVMLSPTVKRVDALVEALRALARGERQQRVNPDDFAGLGEVARAMNEVAASMTEGEDPNLGPVKSQPHPTFKKRPERATPPPRELDEPDLSDHPELGRVRVLKKKEKPSELTMSEAISEAMATAQAKARNGTPLPAPSTGRPEKAAPQNDTHVDDVPRDARDSHIHGSDEIGVGQAAVPSRAELEALFQEFVAAKKSHQENVADLDLNAFAQTIEGECERLILAHQCKGVRFEVTMQDGEVSLRPRLLR